MDITQRSASNNSDRPDPYSYQPLNSPQWVRILALRPGPQDQKNIDCEIIQLPSLKLNTAGRHDAVNAEDQKAARTGFKVERGLTSYEAISWFWGTQLRNKVIQIRVDGIATEFLLSEHLYQALHSLRDAKKTRYLWIDMVCIDQGNVEERNQQVPRMSEIYGEAENVCVWLKAGNSATKTALNFIKHELKTPWKSDLLWNDSKYRTSWEALLELMKSEWFSRRWVVQEVALARKATVYCGRDSVTWRELETAVSVFVEFQMTHQKHPTLPCADQTPFNVSHDRDIFKEVPDVGASRLVNTTSRLLRRSVNGIHQRSISLEELVAELAASETSEPRDIIYALLALAKDTQPSLDEIATQIEGPDGQLRKLSPNEVKMLQVIARQIPNPSRRRYVVDYKQPIVDVYQQFIAFALSRADPTRALDVILRPFARSYKQSQDYKFDKDAEERFRKSGAADEEVRLPSWIPNAKNLPFVSQPFRRRRTFADGAPTDHPFIHSVERHRGDSFVGSPGSRQTLYSAAGTRTYDNKKVRFRKRRDHFSLFAEGFILAEVAVVGDPATMGNIPGGWFTQWKSRVPDEWDTVWKTLVANRDSDGRNPPPFYGSALFAALGDNTEGTSYRTDWLQQEGGAQLIAKALLRVKETIWERRLIVVESGRGNKMLGLASSGVQKDDVVCILYGCSVPVIMRRSKIKTQEEVDDEQQQDEADYQERLIRLKSLLQKIIGRWKARRGDSRGQSAMHANSNDGAGQSAEATRVGPSAESTTPNESFSTEQAVAGAEDDRDREVSTAAEDTGPSTISTKTTPLLQLVHRPIILRLIGLALFTFFVTFLLAEPLAANVINVLASTHIIHDILAHRQEDLLPFTDNASWSAVAVLLLLTAMPAFGLSSRVSCTILAVSALLLPQLYPSIYTKRYRRLSAFVVQSITGSNSTALENEYGRNAETQGVRLNVPHLDHNIATNERALDGRGSPSAQSAMRIGTEIHRLPERPTAEQPVPARAPSTPAPPVPGPAPPVPEPADKDTRTKLSYFYTVVGEAYIHGMMDGEAIEWQNESALPKRGPYVGAEMFEIR